MKWKITYMLAEEQNDGSKHLVVVPHAEWISVVKANNGLSEEQKRCFIRDIIIEKDKIDLMVYEAPRTLYLEWHRTQEEARCNWNTIKKNNIQFLSIEALTYDEDRWVNFLERIMPDDVMPDMVISQMDVELLRAALDVWKPWANDLLDCYMNGESRSCTNRFAEKYSVSPQTIRKYKRQFKAFVKNFFEGVSF